jgi:hypothetical protein
MNNTSLIDQINVYAGALRSAARWHNSKEAVSKVELKQQEKNGSDYIYEFYCYVRILSDLTHSYEVEFKEGTGKHKTAFPQAPSPKKGRPCFLLKDKDSQKVLYQVCAGTEINTRFATKRAPDISFQIATASDDPTVDDVVLIMDAKFNRSNSEKDKIGLGQLSYVAMMIRDLEVDKACDENILFLGLRKFKGNCLLTNRGAHSTNAAYNRHHCIIEVENFTVDIKFNCIG